jgi:hypothetical protein
MRNPNIARKGFAMNDAWRIRPANCNAMIGATHI